MSDVIDPRALAQIADLVPDGDARRAFVAEIVDMFLRTVPSVIAALGGAHDGGDARALAHEAHRLKGMSLSLGATQMVETCKALEDGGRTGRVPADASALLERLGREFLAAQAELDRDRRPAA